MIEPISPDVRRAYGYLEQGFAALKAARPVDWVGLFALWLHGAMRDRELSMAKLWEEGSRVADELAQLAREKEAAQQEGQ